jgi:hypothetical protein
MRPAETRMGSEKGSPECWVFVIRPGQILYEMGGVSETVARAAARIAAYKMPIRTQFVTKPIQNQRALSSGRRLLVGKNSSFSFFFMLSAEVKKSFGGKMIQSQTYLNIADNSGA